MLDLFPGGFEEAERRGVLELVAYTDAAGAASMWRAFGEYSWSEVPEDWQHRWREFHHGVRIGSMWVGPPWEAARADAPTVVVIDPGRAFGTGAHPTTRLCLEQLLELAPEGGSLLDVGCGSAVLAIAAAKLGFSPVLALDHDPATLAAAAENVRANEVEVELRQLDALDDRLPPARLAVANIAATTVEELAPRLRVERLLSSGYLDSVSLEAAGFRLLGRRTLDGWAADLWEALPRDAQ